jgi:hypothetical protein
VFLLTAAAAFYAAFGRGLRYGALLGGLAVIVSWMAFWDAVVDPSSTAVRLLFLVIGVILAVGAVRLHRDDAHEAPELVTAAGIAGVGAGVTGLFNIFAGLIGTSLTSAFGGESSVSGAQQRQEWDVFLLLLALALIWYGLRAVWRGPVYVGAVALLAFTLSVGYQVSSLFAGEGASGDLVGWPLLLLLVGGLALLAGLFGGSDRAAAEPAAAVPPAAPPPGSPPPGQP